MLQIKQVITVCILLTTVSCSLYIPWTDENCNTNGDNELVVWGLVTDAICCNGTASGTFSQYCAGFNTESKCDEEDRCIWKYAALETGVEGQCKPNRDAVNNVCCRPEDTMLNCVAIMEGMCPQAWQIPEECCPSPYNKYALTLNTSSPGTVCCNAPCVAIELAWAGNNSTGLAANPACTAELSPNCAPTAKSALSGLNMFGGQNMNPFIMSQLLNFPVSNSMRPGQSNSYLDSVDSMVSGDLGNMVSLMNSVNGNKENYVEEITVDDFFSALIDALDNDNDVFQYKSDTLATKFGKQTTSGFNPFSGGMLGLILAMSGMGSYSGFSYPNAYSNFLTPMYSYNNPYGYSMAQYQYGMTFGYDQSQFQSPQDPMTMPGMENYSPYAFQQKYQSVIPQQPQYNYQYYSQYPQYYQGNYYGSYPAQSSYGSSYSSASQSSYGSTQSQQSNSPTQGQQVSNP